MSFYVREFYSKVALIFIKVRLKTQNCGKKNTPNSHSIISKIEKELLKGKELAKNPISPIYKNRDPFYCDDFKRCAVGPAKLGLYARLLANGTSIFRTAEFKLFMAKRFN